MIKNFKKTIKIERDNGFINTISYFKFCKKLHYFCDSYQSLSKLIMTYLHFVLSIPLIW